MELPDRINSLPKDLLRDIVSFLPIEEAVNTSILSKALRDAWYSFPKMIFKYHKFPEIEGKKERFLEFIEGTLARHDTTNVETFELHLDIPLNESEILIRSDWIQFAIHHNVRRIFLQGDMDESENIPECLFMSNSLVILELVMQHSVLPKLENVHLPHLKDLRLKELMIEEDAIEVLLPKCPTLELLAIVCCDFFSNSLTISSAKLKKLVLFQFKCIDYNSLILQTPMLTDFTLVGNIVKEYKFMVMPLICSVYVSFGELYPDEINKDVVAITAIKLYKSLLNVPVLFLNERFIQILLWAPDIMSLLGNVTLGKLVSLSLYIWPMRKYIEILMLILSRCPNIRQLNIILLQSSNATVNMQEPNHHAIEGWNFTGSMKNLTHVNIHKFEGNENEFEILKLLIENAPTLISLKVILSSDEINQSDENNVSGIINMIAKKISTFKRASLTTITEVHGVLGCVIRF